MKDELPDAPKPQKPASQLFYGKSVSANSIENNKGLDRTSLTPTKPPAENIPYVLNNNRLDPISDDIVPTKISTGTINLPSPSTDPGNTYVNSRANIRSSLPPLTRQPVAKIESTGKKHSLAIILIISTLVIALGVLLVLIYNNPSTKTYIANLTPSSALPSSQSANQSRVLINIGEKCPALKNNISEFRTSGDYSYNFALTKNGDFYYLNFDEVDKSEVNSIGKCIKISGITNIKDFLIDAYFDVSIVFNDNTIKSYTPSIGKDAVKLSEISADKDAFPLIDSQYAANVKKYQIKQSFYQSGYKEPFFIDSNNNIYDYNFKKLFDGSKFDSQIKPIFLSKVSLEHTNYFISKAYVYKLEFKYQVGFDKTPPPVEINLKDKANNFYGLKPENINQAFQNQIYQYVLGEDGTIYKLTDATYASPETTSTSAVKTIALYVFLIVAGVYILSLLITIILAYRGEYNGYFAGLKMMLIFMLFLAIALAGFASTTSSGNNVSVFSLIPLTIGCLVYFTSYYILKRIVWYIMHKSNRRSKLIFAVVYSLIYFVIATTTILIRL